MPDVSLGSRGGSGGGGGSVATDAIWTAKGQLAAATGTAAAVALAAGVDGYRLAADSAQAAGVKWAAGPGQVGAPMSALNEWGVPGVAVTNFNSSTGSRGNNALNFAEFHVHAPITITACMMRTIGAIGGTDLNARVGMWASDANGPTGAPLHDTVLNFPAASGAGTNVSASISVTLQPGRYWQGGVWDSASNNWHAWPCCPLNAIGIPNGASGATGGSYGFAYGALPTNPTARSGWSYFFGNVFIFYRWTVL